MATVTPIEYQRPAAEYLSAAVASLRRVLSGARSDIEKAALELLEAISATWRDICARDQADTTAVAARIGKVTGDLTHVRSMIPDAYPLEASKAYSLIIGIARVVSVACDDFAHTTTGTATVTISKAAPVGGVVVDLTSSVEAKATVPASVTVAAGDTTADFTVTGVAAGATDLGASVAADTPTTHTLTLS